ncbi:MAG: DUF2802 domain-containing protein [Rhodocyclaceae bacterium]|nr:DUF2802 domain-containing protein [Rhodocyclaceae bacterium]
MGTRTLIWAVIGLLATYVAFQLLQIGRRQGAAGKPRQTEATLPDPATPASDGGKGDDGQQAQQTGDTTEDGGDDSERVGLELQQLRRDVAQLRGEQEAQRKEVGRLGDEVSRLEQALAGVHAMQQASPQYREAVMLARQGLESEAIAERCSISVAEAALVKSLARRGEGEGEHDEA